MNINNNDTVQQATNQENAEKDMNQAVAEKIPEGQPTPETKETEEDPNWRAFREARKKDRAEREAAEKRAREKEAEAKALKEAMEAAFAREEANKYISPRSTQEFEETEDQRIERKVQEAIRQRDIQYQREREEHERNSYPQRLQQTFPDFNQMLSQENLDYLDYHYPEVSRPLQRLQDGFDKYADIYHAIKKFVPNQANVRKDSQKADINQMKPRSISSGTVTQPQEAKGAIYLTEERRAANWERMQRAMKGLS